MTLVFFCLIYYIIEITDENLYTLFMYFKFLIKMIGKLEIMFEILAVAALICLFIFIINQPSEKILERSGACCIVVGIFAFLHGVINLLAVTYHITVPSFILLFVDIYKPKIVEGHYFLYVLQMSSYVFNILVGFIFVKNSRLTKRWILLLIFGVIHLLLTIVFMIVSFSSTSFILFLSSISYIIGIIKQYKTSEL